LVCAGGRYAGLWWDELMNDRPALEPSPTTAFAAEERPPAANEAVLNEGSDTP
jgi:hypothetical protein